MSTCRIYLKVYRSDGERWGRTSIWTHIYNDVWTCLWRLIQIVEIYPRNKDWYVTGTDEILLRPLLFYLVLHFLFNLFVSPLLFHLLFNLPNPQRLSTLSPTNDVSKKKRKDKVSVPETTSWRLFFMFITDVVSDSIPLFSSLLKSGNLKWRTFRRGYRMN